MQQTATSWARTDAVIKLARLVQHDCHFLAFDRLGSGQEVYFYTWSTRKACYRRTLTFSRTCKHLSILSSSMTSPKMAGRPSTSTQPALIKASASRREQMPFIAIKRFSRIPPPDVELANRTDRMWTLQLPRIFRRAHTPVIAVEGLRDISVGSDNRVGGMLVFMAHGDKHNRRFQL